jgi:uncharacterized protein YegP (UPF0339 family)
MSKRIVVQRTDKKWGWQLVTDNGNIVATDGGQGYENESDAKSMADRIIGGEFKDAQKFRRPL